MLRQLRFLLPVLTVLSVGCANVSGPVIIEEESGSPDIVIEPAGRAEEQPPTGSESSVLVGQAAEEPQTVGSSAVDTLLEEGEQRYLDGDYQGAIATGERALRIDRLNPRIYLLIAKSYWSSGAFPQARQSATQGIQYSAEGSYVRQQLERYR